MTSRVRGHVPREVVPLAERLSADLASQLVVLASLHRVELALVMRSHVVDEVGRHAEAGVALGAPVLRQIQRRERRRQRPAGTNPAARRRRSRRSYRRRRSEEVQHLVNDRVRRSVDERKRDTGVHPHLWSQICTPTMTRGHFVVITAAAVVVIVVVVESVNRM